MFKQWANTHRIVALLNVERELIVKSSNKVLQEVWVELQHVEERGVENDELKFTVGQRFDVECRQPDERAFFNARAEEVAFTWTNEIAHISMVISRQSSYRLQFKQFCTTNLLSLYILARFYFIFHVFHEWGIKGAVSEPVLANSLDWL